VASSGAELFCVATCGKERSPGKLEVSVKHCAARPECSARTCMRVRFCCAQMARTRGAARTGLPCALLISRGREVIQPNSGERVARMRSQSVSDYFHTVSLRTQGPIATAGFAKGVAFCPSIDHAVMVLRFEGRQPVFGFLRLISCSLVSTYTADTPDRRQKEIAILIANRCFENERSVGHCRDSEDIRRYADQEEAPRVRRSGAAAQCGIPPAGRRPQSRNASMPFLMEPGARVRLRPRRRWDRAVWLSKWRCPAHLTEAIVSK